MKAKTKFTKPWSILLALAMVVGMLPTIALAAGSESADFVSDPTTALALLNAAKTGTADSTWDNDTKTLTLGGVNFETTAATAVKLPDGATIVLNGENIIKSGSRDYCYGIYAEGSLTISGSGTLNVTGDTAGTYSYGIYTNNGNISVTGGTVNAYGGNADYSYGIYAKQDMNIEDGTVNAYGGEAKYSRGIEAGNDISISGGIVNTIGGKASRFISYGICAGNSLIISCGSLIAAGTSGSNNICALNMPSITLPGTPYWWRTSDSGAYTASTDTVYTLSSSHSYVEIRTAYTVTFDANGANASVAPASGTTNAAGKLTSLPTPTRSGYTFKEWNTEQDGTGTKVTSETTFTENTTVYAQWEVVTVTIPSVAITGVDAPKSNTALDTEADCDTTGVSNTKPTVTWDSSDSKAGYGKIYTASITLTASEGYKFANSVTATVNGNPATSVTKNANGTLTVTYTFPATDKHNIEITVDTDVRDGDAAKNPTISSGYEIEYCFFVEDTDKDGVFINKTGDSITFDDKTLVVDKALVEAFAAQSGGRFTYESLMAVLKDEFDLDELKTEFTGGYDYSVLAYIYHSDNAYFDYDDNQIVTNAIVKVNGKKITDNCLGYGGGMDILPGAYVFSAAKTYTVSFDANGGKGTMADVTGISGEYTLPENGFTAPEGKQFKAWSVGGTEKAVGDKITVTANITVTAVWENIPAGHTCDIKPVAKVNPSCTEGGKEAYYKCKGCGKFFEDVLGTKEITDLAAWGNIPKNGHTESDWKSDDADHWKECTVVGCGVIIEGSKEAHTASDWITDTAATATTAGTEHKECTTCGYVMETGKIPATGSVTAQKIIEGDGAKVTHGEKTELSFRSDADFSDFIRVEIDGKTLDAKNYTVKEGSTIVTLDADYVSTLSVGTHTIGVVSNNGTATATFTVEAKQTTGDKDNPNTGAQENSPQTCDNNMMALWIAVLFVSGFGVVATAVYGKKRKSVK